MSDVLDRTVMAQSVIVLAVCLGAWFVFVEPKGVEARLLEAEIRAGSEQAASIDHSAVQRLAERLDLVRQQVRQIEQRGMITRDSSHLYSVIMNLAREHDVTVSSLNPGMPSATRTSGRDKPLAVYREITVNLSGRYIDVAAFVESLQSMEGYIELQYLSVAAASGQPGVLNARIIGRAVRFTLPENLREMLGSVESPSADAPLNDVTPKPNSQYDGAIPEAVDELTGGGSDA